MNRRSLIRKLTYLVLIAALLAPLSYFSLPATVATQNEPASPGGKLAQLRDDLDPARFLEPPDDPAPSERLDVDDDGAQRHGLRSYRCTSFRPAESSNCPISPHPPKTSATARTISFRPWWSGR